MAIHFLVQNLYNFIVQQVAPFLFEHYLYYAQETKILFSF